MSYGKLQKLLTEEFNALDEEVLLESPFYETQRSGLKLQELLIGITTNNLLIAKTNFTHVYEDDQKNNIEIKDIYPIKLIVLRVFKQTRRQTLKATFIDKSIHYYELGKCSDRQLIWKRWCKLIIHLYREDLKLYRNSNVTISSNITSKQAWDNIRCTSLQTLQKYRWRNKDIYLGDKRYLEDKDRPMPIPGLCDINELYLKQNFESTSDENPPHATKQDQIWDNDIYTYTGEPTSNITYTSIMNTVC